jgi:hypothetical protein
MVEVDADKNVSQLFEELRRHHAALVVARIAVDRVGAFMAGVRAKNVVRALESHAVADSAVAAFIAREIADHEALIMPPMYVLESDYSRVERWMAVGREPRDLRRADPDLFEIDCKKRRLAGLRLSSLYVAQSVFVSAMLAGVSFDGAVFEDCDLSFATLDRTSWCGTRLVRCTLHGCSLVDAMLDGACFVDCMFRGADLGASQLGARATARGTAFVRCDLRDTGWHERVLAGTKLDHCQLDGVHGRPLLEGIEIVAPDLSRAGDGSRLGSVRDVLRRWYRPRWLS